MQEKKCSALKAELLNDIGSVRFPNPQNPKEMIYRSKKARQIVAHYKTETGFTGPN